MTRATFTNRALLSLLTAFVVASALGNSTEPARIRITTWNLEWFPNGSAHDATPEVQAQRIAAAADVLRPINPDIILKHLLARRILLVSFLFAEQLFRYGSQELQLSASGYCAELSTIHMRHRIGVCLPDNWFLEVRPCMRSESLVIGNVTQNSVHWRSERRSVTSPLCARAISRAMLSPRPCPAATSPLSESPR
jgi:hypothetical protein